MGEAWYKLVFKQIQPIHIGAGSYGVINETRIFIPGWTMWGALTKAYNVLKGEPIDQIKESFENISCFYPSIGKSGDIMFPHFNNGTFHLGEYSENQFRSLFADTYVSTAILPRTQTALDNSLHEINVVLPKPKKIFKKIIKETSASSNVSSESNLYWHGIVKLNDEIKNFLKTDMEIFVGGDKRYGFGLLKLESIKTTNEKEVEHWKMKDGDGILVNYFPVKEGNSIDKKISGRIERIVEIKKSWEGALLKVKENEDKGSEEGKKVGNSKNGEEKITYIDGFYYIPGSAIDIKNNNKVDINNFNIVKGTLQK